MIKIGSHVSYSKDGMIGCIKESIKYGSNTFMFYTGAPQNTIRKDINMDNVNKAKDLLKENNININVIVVHAPYIVNLATPKEENFKFSIEFLKKEIERCNLLGVSILVLHPGNAVGITKEEGLNNLIRGLKELSNDNVCIALETMAGKGTEVCSLLEELKYVFDNTTNLNIGVTLDTCHLNDSGVDISLYDQYLEEFDKLIGIDKIKCIHINDSKNILGARKDRHENIGFGTIGFDSLINVIYNEKLKDVPKILETPYIKFENKSFAPYKEEIAMIKSKTFNNNLIEDIISNENTY